MCEDLLMQRFGDRVYLLGEPPERTQIARDMLVKADRSRVAMAGDLLTIRLDNRVIDYRVTGDDPLGEVYELELVDSRKITPELPSVVIV